MAKRIFIESQSGPNMDSADEQNYDQRGPLCQAEEDDLIVTTAPMNASYLEYWQSLGMPIPLLLHSTGFIKGLSLSDHVVRNSALSQQIQREIEPESVLELFWVSQKEQQLANHLGIPASCNIPISSDLARKTAFKTLCENLSIPSPRYAICHDRENLLKAGARFMKSHAGFLVKADLSTGGTGLGMLHAFNEKEYENLKEALDSNLSVFERLGTTFLVEARIKKAGEFSVHFHIAPGEEPKLVEVFEQLSSNAYIGACFPPRVDPKITQKAAQLTICTLGQFLKSINATGYFCCDILVDNQGKCWWIDFNPRKGAILYVYFIAQRLAKKHFKSETYAGFYHKHVRLPNGKQWSFEKVHAILDKANLLSPRETFIALSNPGLYEFGCADITGISETSSAEAQKAVGLAQNILGIDQET